MNQLINDVYTKNESDEKYLNKNNVINELNYSRTDIETLGNLKSSFVFTNITADDLRNGFVFSYYDTSITTGMPPIISHKYTFDYEITGDRYYYLSEDKSTRLMIAITSTSTADNICYIILLYEVNNHNNQKSTFLKYEWYLESGYKFDSSNVYCREIVDELTK